MLVSNAAPMVAAVACGGKTSWDRQDRREPFLGRGMKRGHTATRPAPEGDRRTLKHAERLALRRELDAWDGDDPAPVLVRVDDEFGWRYDVLDYEAERAECDTVLNAIEWNSGTLEKGVRKLTCSKCSSDLLVPDDPKKDVAEITLVCRACGASSNAWVSDAWGLGYIYNDDAHPGKGKKR